MVILFFFFFNDTATTEIYTLSLHDALPISPRCRSAARARSRTWRRGSRPTGACVRGGRGPSGTPTAKVPRGAATRDPESDRKSTRLNSSHANISYAVFCLKKKKKKQIKHEN